MQTNVIVFADELTHDAPRVVDTRPPVTQLNSAARFRLEGLADARLGGEETACSFEREPPWCRTFAIARPSPRKETSKCNSRNRSGGQLTTGADFVKHLRERDLANWKSVLRRTRLCGELRDLGHDTKVVLKNSDNEASIQTAAASGLRIAGNQDTGRCRCAWRVGFCVLFSEHCVFSI